MRKIPGRIKKWDHLAVRPETFEEFRELRPPILRKDGTRKIQNNTSDNAFVKELLRVYKLYLQMKKRKEQQNNEDKKYISIIHPSIHPIVSSPIGVPA